LFADVNAPACLLCALRPACLPAVLAFLVFQALAARDAELEDLRSKHSGLTRQYDEAVHRINLAKQVRLWTCDLRDLRAQQHWRLAGTHAMHCLVR
jgi:hypothetical protein